jgi:hypothetical protein
LQALNKYQVQTKAWCDNNVVPREFNEGDLVLMRIARTESQGKLEPKWEVLEPDRRHTACPSGPPAHTTRPPRLSGRDTRAHTYSSGL